jgi:hypothetical protein
MTFSLKLNLENIHLIENFKLLLYTLRFFLDIL